MQGAQIWLPNIEGFFTSLGRLLESAEGQRNTVSYDSAEFFSCHLRENCYEQSRLFFNQFLDVTF